MSGIVIKNKRAIERMRVGGKLLAGIMQEVGQHVVDGKNTYELDFFIEKSMRQVGLKPVCKGYAGYKFATCISLNDVVVHGIPSKEIILKNGDFVKIDVVGSYDGYCVDMARYFFVGAVADVVKKLAYTAQCALDSAISKVLVGNRLSDISFRVQEVVERDGFGIVRDFAGHGIGKNIHEEPEIPNYGRPGCGPVLREGMALAIEPMITQHSYEVKIMSDGWTAKTVDGGLAAHVEDTVIVTEHGPEVLTRL